MWNRKMLKENGKAAFRRNYWWAVLWAVVFTVLVAAGTGGDGGSDTGIWELGLSTSATIWLGALTGSVSLLIVVARIVVGGPFRVGYSRWLLKCAESAPESGDIGYYFRSGQLGRTIAGIFCTDLVTALWTLLFIIPGIVASYRFRLVPYLMAENEGMSGKEARRISTELMRGYKMDAFLLDLSFIGWFLLNVLTLGILSIFFINPYFYATHCEFYRAIRDCSAANNQNQGGWQPQGNWQAGGAEPYQQNNGTWQASNPYWQDQGGWQNSDANWNQGGWQDSNANRNQDGWQSCSTEQNAQNAGSSDAAPAPEADDAVPGPSAGQESQTEQSQAPDVQICPHCGHRVTGPAHFCNMCGGRL